MIDKNEDNLKRAAEMYAEAYGQSLMSELDDMRARRVSYMTPRADGVVRDLSRLSTRIRRKRFTGALAAVAACLVIAIAIPQIMDRTTTGPATPSVSDDAPSSSPSLIDWTVMQPLSFTLPDEFEIESSELDNGMSIYRLDSNSELYPDNVVLTMQEPEGDVMFLGTETVYIDDKAVRTKLDDGYVMLLFEKDDMFYTLSCENDLGTLTYLYRCIEGTQI